MVREKTFILLFTKMLKFYKHSDFYDVDRDEVYLAGGLETIFDKNKVDIYAEYENTLECV